MKDSLEGLSVTVSMKDVPPNFLKIVTVFQMIIFVIITSATVNIFNL